MKVKVIISDPSEKFRAILKKILQEANYVVIGLAKNGKETINLIKETSLKDRGLRGRYLHGLPLNKQVLDLIINKAERFQHHSLKC